VYLLIDPSLIYLKFDSTFLCEFLLQSLFLAFKA
jgi:hypothetical protein